MAHTTPWYMHMALIIQLLLASMLVLPRAESSGSYLRAELIHVDANGGFTREELIRRAADRAHLRAAMLSSTTQDTKMKVEASFSHYEYLMRMEVVVDGDGKTQSFSAVADTGSDYIWTKMETFSTLAAVPCRCTSGKDKMYAFNRTYGGGHKAAQGFMCSHRNKLRLLSSSSSKTETEIKADIKLGFAIHYDDHLLPVSADGIVGLNRGQQSLLAQLVKKEHIANKFSYCLSNSQVSESNQVKSPFWFGGDPLIDGLTSTPLAEFEGKSTPSLNHEMYYVELLAISLDDGKNTDPPIFLRDGEKTDDPEHYFKYKSKQGNGVMFIDSGCSYTKLETPVFKKLKNMLGKKLEKMLDKEQGKESSITKDGKVHTCFPVKKAPALDLVLHLGLDGAKMRIPWDNYMVQDKPESEFCLTINETAGVSIMGNILQHDIYMHYDLTQKPEGKLSFKKVDDCSKLL